MRNLKLSMVTIYRDEEVRKTLKRAEDLVKSNTPERRNRAETIPIVFERLLYAGYYEITNRGHVQRSEHVIIPETLNIPFTIDGIEKGDIIYRYYGVQQCLDIVSVDRVCEITIRGTCGEIVRPEQIIIITRKVLEMKRVTKIYLSTEKQDTTMCFDTYEDFAKCAGFWWNSCDGDYYYSEESTIFKMYKVSSELLCTVERVVNGVNVRIITDWE